MFIEDQNQSVNTQLLLVPSSIYKHDLISILVLKHQLIYIHVLQATCSCELEGHNTYTITSAYLLNAFVSKK